MGSTSKIEMLSRYDWSQEYHEKVLQFIVAITQVVSILIHIVNGCKRVQPGKECEGIRSTSAAILLNIVGAIFGLMWNKHLVMLFTVWISTMVTSHTHRSKRDQDEVETAKVVFSVITFVAGVLIPILHQQKIMDSRNRTEIVVSVIL